KMANSSLIEYVRKYKDQYSVESLRTYLIQQGYNPEEVNHAIKIATVKKTKPLLKIFLALLMFFLAVFAVYIWTYSETFNIFLKLTPQTTTQESLVFSATFGASRESSGRYSFSLYNEKNEKLLDEAGYVQVNKETKLSFPIKLTDLSNGKHNLVFTFYAENKKVEDSFSFEINRNQSSTKIENPLACPHSCSDNNPATVDECLSGKCVNTLINKCGNNFCDSDETIFLCPEDCKPKKTDSTENLQQRAFSLAQSDPELAANTCLQLATGSDECLRELSSSYDNPDFCRVIVNFEIKDSCYSSYALKSNNFSVCSLITDLIKQKACFSLKKANLYST
ncbi:hypothetical protein HY837_03005, partial [archaeon]|nr:hypothetical protein [archaeon]